MKEKHDRQRFTVTQHMDSPKKEAEVEFIDPRVDAERMLEKHRA